MNHGIAWGAVVALLVGYCVVRQRSSISHIRGPPSPSWIFGNMLQFRLPSSYGDCEFKWFKIYGPVYRLKGCFGQNRLMVSDLLACQYILKSPHFALSPTTDNTVRLVVGDRTILRMRGKAHQHLRNGLNPGFTAAAARSFQPIFDNVAQAASFITQELELSGTAPIDIVPPLGIATFTAIAGAALGYSLDDLGEEYVATTQRIMVASSTQTAGHILADALGARLPTWLLRAALHLPTKTFNAARKASHLAQSLGAQAVKEKHDLVQQGLNTDGDIFGILLDQVHSNTERIPLTGEEIVDQTQTIMTAGQEHPLTIHHFLLSFFTKTIAFGLWELAKDPKLQESLRAEIHSSPGEAGQNGAYDQMPLLNAFIKETLRFYPAEAFAERMVVKDTIIPLSESITTSTGKQISEISVSKGQVVIVGIASYHRLESHWGADADKFRPSRWFEDTILNADAVGPYANLLAFLTGPHTCLG
ncbi:cytochrome P450 [Mycena albidolilacea]|uniref:Cytochrome P450 n=1 Tax=Mycena albidolilacea TaxID=1033008 RepID=A0AAD7EDZ2_9AGAR|nr:cytochrome P450 [Mycena albidolilacea]